MGEFSFPRLVVFCLLPVTYKRGLGSVHLYLLRQTLPPTVGDLAWTFTSPFLSSSSSLQVFLIIGFCKEGRGEERGKPNSAPFFCLLVILGEDSALLHLHSFPFLS